ncbi:MAG TPA: 2-phospho-L-lactate guanylyltransferase [Stellaceae bacterium]|nr:2-phospho-L-lactate guanylyltransferase [Stellaceae bacterium]
MTGAEGIWAVVPVKELGLAKQRLAELVPGASREALALAMLEDVLAAIVAALVESPGLAGLAVVTVDPMASRLAARYGARLVEAGARDGHTGAVAAAARLLAAEKAAGILALPGDIPLVTPAEIAAVLRAHRPAPAFTIAPSHDEQGSNAVLCSPPEAVPLRFGEDSFFPHLRAAEERGILPTVLRLPGIALDIDNPQDLRRFARIERDTRTRGLILAQGLFKARDAAIGGRAG